MNRPDAKDLARAGRKVPLPFALPLGDGKGTLRCHRLLRVIPGRRAVLQAEWEGHGVLAKLFYAGSGRGRHLRREREGYGALSRNEIPSPRLLYEGESGGVGFLLFEFLEGARSLQVVLAQGPDAPGTAPALEGALELLSLMHEGGLVQQDLHLGNFLVQEGQVLAADCGSVIDRGRPLQPREARQDLARFCAQLPLAFADRIPDLLARYGNLRGWADPDPGAFEALVARRREARVRNFLRKVYRDSTRIACIKAFSWRALWDRDLFSEEAAAVLAQTDPKLLPPGAEVMKAGRTTTVFRMEVRGRSLVVKRYNIKGPRHGLSRAFRRTRASHSWRNAHGLEMLGIPTPRPVAMVERRWGPWRGTAYFVSEYVAGPDAFAFFSGEGGPEARRAVAHRLVAILRSLALARITHGDTKATNFILGEGGPVVVDLDAMRWRRSAKRFEKLHQEDIGRFLENWEKITPIFALFKEMMGEVGIKEA